MYLDLQFAFILNFKLLRNIARFIRLQGCGLCGVSGRQVCRFSGARARVCLHARADPAHSEARGQVSLGVQ